MTTISDTLTTQPGAGAPASLGTPPPSHLAMAIISALFFWPLGIPAIINAAKVDRMIFMGDHAGAELASSQAKKWSMWALGVAIGGVLLYLIIMATVIASIIGSAASNPALNF
jgi:Interferon-induced transmembrane protein